MLTPSLNLSMTRALTEHRVVVIGGYGFFGRRLVERLTSQPDAHVIVAGRSLQDAQALVDRLRPQAKARLEAAVVDAMSVHLRRELERLSPTTVVLASGPFQGQDYRVARTCISVGANYIDLADARAFVVGIRELDSNEGSRRVRQQRGKLGPSLVQRGRGPPRSACRQSATSTSASVLAIGPNGVCRP